MKKILNTILVINLLLAYSCKKNVDTSVSATEKAKSIYELVRPKSDWNGNISISASNSMYQPTLQNFDINAYFEDAKGIPTKADIFQVGQVAVDETPNFRYYTHIFGKMPNRDKIVDELFGKQVKIVIKSQGFGDVTYSMYSPSYVNIELPTDVANTLKFNKSQGLTIKWNPDNSLSTRGDVEKQVGVSVVYHAGYSSNLEQTGMPKENVTAFKLANDAAGQVTFTPQELAKLPVNGNVCIYVARANQEVATSTSGQKLGITSFSMGYSPEVKTQ